MTKSILENKRFIWLTLPKAQSNMKGCGGKKCKNWNRDLWNSPYQHPLFPWLAHLFSCTTQDYLPWVSSHINQFKERKERKKEWRNKGRKEGKERRKSELHRLAHRPIWWRQFLNWDSLFPNTSVPSWQKIASTGALEGNCRAFKHFLLNIPTLFPN